MNQYSQERSDHNRGTATITISSVMHIIKVASSACSMLLPGVTLYAVHIISIVITKNSIQFNENMRKPINNIGIV